MSKVNSGYHNANPKDCSKLNLDKEIEETFNILSVGRLHEQKGIFYLLHAFKQLENKIDNIKLILVGQSNLNKNQYRDLIESDKSIIHISFIPNEKISCIYNLCDIFILPSITMPNNEEQFGMSVLEAMACGKPSIVTDVGGLPYIVDPGNTSLIIPERSSEAIVKSIIRLYDDKDLRDRLGKYAYTYVRENFSKEVVGNKLYEFYTKLMVEH